jgi:protein SCO1/2
MSESRKNNSGLQNWGLLIVVLLGMYACKDGGSGATIALDPERKLPYIGEHEVEFVKKSDGELIPDTVYYTLPKFSFINQDSAETSHRNYAGKVFVADFFFTHCPSICPMLSSQMVRLQALTTKAGLHDEVMFLSHTVDPLRDSPDTLKNYAMALGADLSNWNFVTGSAEDIYWQAEYGYMLTAFPSDSAEGGFFHTDKIALIDRQMHIRGMYDGTSTKDVDKLFEDIKLLVKEK